MTSFEFGGLGLTQGRAWGLALAKTKNPGAGWGHQWAFRQFIYTSSSKSGRLHSGGYCGLSLEILSSANVITCVNGLKVFNAQDTLGDPCGVPKASVDQPPGVLNRHGPFILLNDTHGGWSTNHAPLSTAPIHLPLLSIPFKAQNTCSYRTIWYAQLMGALTLSSQFRLHFFFSKQSLEFHYAVWLSLPALFFKFLLNINFTLWELQECGAGIRHKDTDNFSTALLLTLLIFTPWRSGSYRT